MGCDYYMIIDIIVYYYDSEKNLKTDTINIKKLGCYYDYDYNSDDMTLEEYLDSKTDKTTIYEDSQFKIKNKQKYNYYTDLLSYKPYRMEDVVRIIKHTYCYER